MSDGNVYQIFMDLYFYSFFMLPLRSVLCLVVIPQFHKIYFSGIVITFVLMLYLIEIADTGHLIISLVGLSFALMQLRRLLF